MKNINNAMITSKEKKLIVQNFSDHTSVFTFFEEINGQLYALV